MHQWHMRLTRILQYQLKKQIKEEGTIASLRKENRQLNELITQKEMDYDEVSSLNAALKQEVFRLRTNNKQKEEALAQLVG